MAKDDLEARTVFADPGHDPGDAGTDPDREEKTVEPDDTPLVERTGYAAEGVRVAVLFAHRFGKRLLGTRAHLGVKLNEPGVSTDQGAKARQAIVLVPKSKGRVTTTIGWIDTPRALAEVKSYALVAEQHRARTSDEVDIEKNEYEALLGDLQQFLKSQSITSSIAEATAQTAKGLAPKGSASPKIDVSSEPRTVTLRPGVIALLVLILGMGVAIGVFLSKKAEENAIEEEVVDERPQPAQRQPLRRRLLPNR